MADQQRQNEATVSPESGEEPVPVMQEIVDNIWFLFLLSGVIILVSYIIWGLIDLVNTPVAR